MWRNSAIGSDRCSKYVRLWTIDVWAPNGLLAYIPFHFWQIWQPTESMTVVFDRNAKDLKSMHADCHALDPLLTLENQINGTGKQVDKGVTIRCS